MPFVIGVTGGIGCGKSTVCAMFAAHGAPVLDADDCVRELQRPGEPTHAAIVAAFGGDVLDAKGELDRSVLRERVFGDAGARERLEGIVHPAVRRRIAQWLAAQTYPYCMLAIPLLLEKGGYEFIDRILVVDCDERVQIERVGIRSGLSEEAARRIMAVQVSRSERLARADDVIDNSGSMDDLPDAVERLHAKYLKLAAAAAHHSTDSC